MDIATVLGLLACFGLVIGSILVGGSLGTFINAPSLMIVVGGTAGVALISFPMGRVVGAFQVALNAFRYSVPEVKDQNEKLLGFAEASRKDGILALEGELNAIEDSFMKRGIQMLVDGVDGEKIENMLWDELDALAQRHRQGAQIFESLAAAAPALGLVGTLIGLVQMLQSMDDPSNIGPAMAVALLTTFYGALLANVVFSPIAGKLRARHEEEVLARKLVIKGVVGIASGENPRVLSQLFDAELSPKNRMAQE